MGKELMNLVIVTGTSYEHKYIANILCERFNVLAIIADSGVKKKSTTKLRSYFKRYSLVGLVNLTIRRIINIFIKEKSKRKNSLLRVFRKENCLHFNYPNLLTTVNGVNSPQSEKIIGELQPDILIIYGTSIVRDHILDKAKRIALNMHTGLSPQYRGSACAFWPIYNQEFNQLGATVHKCISNIDAGIIYKKGSITVDHEDDIHSIFAKCVVRGGSLYMTVIDELLLNNTLDGESQNLETGEEYRASMKTWIHEIQARKNLKSFCKSLGV